MIEKVDITPLRFSVHIRDQYLKCWLGEKTCSIRRRQKVRHSYFDRRGYSLHNFDGQLHKHKSIFVAVRHAHQYCIDNNIRLDDMPKLRDEFDWSFNIADGFEFAELKVRNRQYILKRNREMFQSIETIGIYFDGERIGERENFFTAAGLCEKDCEL